MSKHFCAHRGVSALMPENTLPAFASAIALGADEIELDVRLTRDQQLIVSHDGTLDRISDGQGPLSDYTLKELMELNIGLKHGWTVPFCTPEEVFSHFANQTVFNLHLKEHGEEGFLIRELMRLAQKYHAESSIYFAGSPSVLEWMERTAPHIDRAAIQGPKDAIGIEEMAQEYHCGRVQFWLGMFDESTIQRLHEKGVSCNLFYADTLEDYQKYFGMGVDTLLTNRMDLAAHYRKNHL